MKCVLTLVASASLVIVCCGGCDDRGVHPPRVLSNDEQGLWDYLSSRQPTLELKERARDSVEGLQAAGATFETRKLRKKDSEWTDALEMRHTVRATKTTVMGQGKVIGHGLIVVCRAPGDEPYKADAWLDVLLEPTRHRYRVKDIILVYAPSPAVQEKTDRLCALAGQHVMQSMAGLKRAHPQLAEFDDGSLKPRSPGRGQPGRSVPGLRYRYGFGKYIAEGMAYEKTTGHWCEITLVFGSEQLTVWDHMVPNPPGRIGHRTYSKQGLYANWWINSADREFNRNVEGMIVKALLPLEEYEQELGGTVIENNRIKTY